MSSINRTVSVKRINLKTEEDVTDSFVGEVRIFSFNWVPKDWLLCDGSVLPINQYQALFSLLGVTYGGNGSSTFALPDLRGRTWFGGSYAGTYKFGTALGAETVKLDSTTTPTHNHVVTAVGTAASTYNANKGGALYAEAPAGTNIYASASGAPQPLNPAAVGPSGAAAAHNNMQPSAVVNFCICTVGLYPSRT